MFNLIKKLFNINKVNSLSFIEDKLFYFLNDPTTPELKTNISNIFIPKYMPFVVKDFNPKNYQLVRENDYRDLACFYTISQMLNYYQSIIYKLEGSKIKEWFSNKPLFINPRYGKGLNAFYDRNSLIFLYQTSLFKKRTVYSVDSVDIVSHELGHAILDSLRPDLWNMQSLEIWSFHEAFADICAFINVTNNKNVVDRILSETNGDLSKSNIASRLGEDLASSASLNKKYLRDISEKVDYVNPLKINKDSKVIKEPHNFSRILSSALYATFVEIYNIEYNSTKDKIKSFELAKEEMFISLIKAVKATPSTNEFFNAFSRIFILNLKDKYKQVAQNIFENRKIIKPQIKMLNSAILKISDLNLSNSDVVIKNKNNSLFVLKKENINIFYDNCYLKVPGDSFYYTEDSNLLDEHQTNKEMAIEEAISCKKYIEENKYENWNLNEERFLIRTRIS